MISSWNSAQDFFPNICCLDLFHPLNSWLWLRSIKNQYLRQAKWSMKIKFAKISSIDDYIYVLEKNSRFATNFRKKKTKKIVTGLTSRGLVSFSRKSIFLQDSKTWSFTFAFPKFLTKKRWLKLLFPLIAAMWKRRSSYFR